MKKQNEDFLGLYLGLQRKTNLQSKTVHLVIKICFSFFNFCFLQSLGIQKGRLCWNFQKVYFQDWSLKSRT